jgi:hypothetical protein
MLLPVDNGRILDTRISNIELPSLTKRERQTCSRQRRSAEKLNVVESHSPPRQQSGYDASKCTTLSSDTTKEE